MPNTNDINVDPFIRTIPPKTLALWKKTRFEFQLSKLLGFLLHFRGRESFLSEKGISEYHPLVKGIWRSYTAKQVNSPYIGEMTMLMLVLFHTKDHEIIRFAIEQTSNKGVNVMCPGSVDGEHCALAAVCSLELHDYIEPLMARSNTNSLKLTKMYFEVAKNSKTTLSHEFGANIGKSYTLADIDRYIKMIDDRLLKLKFSWVPVLGPFVHDMMYPETTSTSAKAVPAASLGKLAHPTVASTSFSQPASVVQPVAE